MKWLAAICLMLVGVPADAATDLSFAITEGRIENHFFREGPVAAHAVLRSGPDARLVFAFPAGNSGAGLWFGQAVSWRLAAPLAAVQQRLPDGGLRHGIVAEIKADTASLTIERVLVGSIRVLRDHGYGNPIAAEVEAEPFISDGEAIWERRRLDGAPGYKLVVQVLDGAVTMRDGMVMLASRDGPLRLRITALTGDEPLTPLALDQIFKRPDQTSILQQSVAFLAYREKLLAGSWQYNTYFGRDTLMTLALLMGELKPEPIEAGLGAVLERLNPMGEVAHEEDIGEFALIGRSARDARLPVLDYKMVDDDFMLAPVLAAYLLDSAEGHARAEPFLARTDASGVPYGVLVLRNLGFVETRAGSFAAVPTYANLVSLHEGLTVGDWRDSQSGMGGEGRYPFSINGALVPAALAAGARLHASGLLDAYGAQRIGQADMTAMAKIWADEAPRLFAVSLPEREARDRLAAYAEAMGLAMPDHGISGDGDTRYMGLALDATGQPLPVMHSDVGFLLFFLTPDDKTLEIALRQVMRNYPVGLMSGAGLLAANPALAGTERWATFDNTRYHGTVVWSWQQGLLKAGIARQLARGDIAPDTRALLLHAGADLAQAIRRTRDLQGSELWSWQLQGGKIVPLPYGQAAGHETESNAAQLWSAVALANLPGDLQQDSRTTD